MERRRLVATVALLALVALAGCETVPSPEIICSGCEKMPERTDNVTVDDSVTHFYVDSEGDARVEARMRLSGASVDRLRTNQSALQDLVMRIDNGWGPSAFERRNLTGRMDGDTLVVTYRVSDIADKRAGTVVVDAFYRFDGDGREDSDTYDRPYHFGTDRLVVHGPDGTRSLVDPTDGTSDGSRVVWTGEEVSPRTYVVFGSDGALARPAIALETLSWAGGPALWLASFMSVPLLGFAGAFAAYYPRRLDDGWSPGEDLLLGSLLRLGGLIVATFVVSGVLGAPWISLFLFSIVAVVYWRYRGPDGVLAGGRRIVAAAPRTVVSKGLGAEGRAVVSIATVFAAATAVVATDFRAIMTIPVVVIASVVLLVSFMALGVLVTQPSRSVARVSVVTTMAGTVWVFAFATVVESGAIGALDPLAFLLCLSCIVLCPPLFYGTLWSATD